MPQISRTMTLMILPGPKVSRYEKWERDRGGGGGGGGAGGSWGGAGRDRQLDRERERQARAHQMSHAHAAEPDASSLFPAPIRVTGNKDRVTQQINQKLGDYDLAQVLLEDPSKSIGICHEPPSPAPCLPSSRRESEFKKPSHAPQNGRVHHRPYTYNKNEAPGSTGAPPHRPPNLRIPNGYQASNAIDSSQPPIESILKEMKSLPTQVSAIAQTPRKELENKFTFNPLTNRLVQENTPSNDLITPPPKPGLDNRISNSRSSVSPDVVNKDLGLSESDDEVAATTTRLEPILTPIGSGTSPSSSSESSPSDTEGEETSSTESSGPPTAPPVAPAPAPAPTPAPPAHRSSWSLSNFAPPPAQPPDQPYDSSKEIRHALADVKGKPSPISELSDTADTDASSPSPGVRRRRSTANRSSAVSSDEDAPRSHNTVSTSALSHATLAPPLSELSDSDNSSGEEDAPRRHRTTASPRLASTGQKRGRPKKNASEPASKKRRPGRPRKKPESPAGVAAEAVEPVASPHDSDPEPEPAPTHQTALQDTKTHIFRKVFTPKKGDEGGGKGGKGGKGKGGKGKGQVTIIESGADDDDRRHRDRSVERRNEEALARVSPPPETDHRRKEERSSMRPRIRPHSIEHSDHRRSDDRTERIPTERTSNDRIPPSDRMADRLSTTDRLSTDRLSERHTSDRLSPGHRLASDRLLSDRLSDRSSDRHPDRLSDRRTDRLSPGHRLAADRLDRRSSDQLSSERIGSERLSSDRLGSERLSSDRLGSERLSSERVSSERVSGEKTALERLSSEKISDKMSIDRLGGDKLSVERVVPERERYVRAEADVGSGLKSGRGSERLEEASSNLVERRCRSRLLVSVQLSRLRADLVRALQRPKQPAKRPASPPPQDVAATNHERTACAGQTPIYYSYFERLPADALSDEERDHKYYLSEAKRLRTAAEREQEPLSRVMLYLESVLCFVLTGRVLELELDTKRAFTIYRETIEYIKSIHSMPQRFRASPHSTFSKLDILSLRVQALLYLRMFKMYNREVKEYYKIVQEYQQKPAGPESVSPLSPTPSPAGSVGSVGSVASASSGYCSLAHSVPAHAHNALLQLTKYYTFLYVAHELWEQADCLCRLRANQDLFIAVDRKCGPLTQFSTFRHLVQYVRYAISLLKNAPRE
ncbi:AF4/FMR2 family member 4-like [Hyposmocoma kahamanoa]|uniref:AF4/FMR2 family member 4-like n=1 Tax=Hyposmocoma kahamanoa TaxID=1477025 RepID=UPI000E6D80A6|nr:AF4/FMR2 family member 4-like [Hyposmocoma kahamanoa]